MSCLVAHESWTIRQLMRRILEGMGITDIVEVTTGEDALKAITGDTTCLITGWDMPGMDGIDLTRRVRDQENDGHVIPILMVSERAMFADVSLAKSSGVSDYLLRPLNPHLLREKLGRLLRRDA
jgi:two-component system chemotaxis response regulator CheY